MGVLKRAHAQGLLLAPGSKAWGGSAGRIGPGAFPEPPWCGGESLQVGEGG